MLTVFFIMPTLLIVYWRSRMKEKFLFKENYPVFLVLIRLHISDVLFSIMYGFVDIIRMELHFSSKDQVDLCQFGTLRTTIVECTYHMKH